MVKIELEDGKEVVFENAERWDYNIHTALFSVYLKNGEKVAYVREAIKSIRYMEGEND